MTSPSEAPGTAAPAPTRSHRMFEAWNTHEVDRILSLYREDFLFVDPTTSHPIKGHEGLRHYAERMLRTFPDGQFAVLDVVQQGETEVANWEFTGTQSGPFMHRAPTGKRISFRGIDWVEWDGDKVRRNVTFYDTSVILHRLGAE
jgi:steroid delta-isomerase-like uncharacterized protein